MRDHLDEVELSLDESNEFTFGVSISGTNADDVKARFMCEGPDAMSYMFPATQASDGSFRVTMPPMGNLIDENESYTGTLELIAEGRHFTPLRVNLKFKRALSVVAESVKVSSVTQKTNPVQISANVKSVVADISETRTFKPSRPVVPVATQTAPKKITTLTKGDVQSLVKKLDLASANRRS